MKKILKFVLLLHRDLQDKLSIVTYCLYVLNAFVSKNTKNATVPFSRTNQCSDHKLKLPRTDSGFDPRPVITIQSLMS